MDNNKIAQKEFGNLGLRNIKSDEIKTDYYQRKVSKVHIKSIINNFDERLFDPLRVCWRDGAWYCYDGQHRLAAAIKLGFKEIPCLVTKTVTIEEEAKLFVKANTVAASRPLTPYSEIWAGIIANDDEAVKLNKIVEEAGFELGEGLDGNKLAAIRRLQTCLRKYGEKPLALALMAIRTAYPNDPNAKKAKFIEGLTCFIQKTFETINMKKLITKLQTKSVEEINKQVAFSSARGMDKYVYVLHMLYGDIALKIVQ